MFELHQQDVLIVMNACRVPATDLRPGSATGINEHKCMHALSVLGSWPPFKSVICPPLHQLRQMRARPSHRSLSKQALMDLQDACRGDSRERRRQALADLASERGGAEFEPSPEALIRADWER